MALDRDALARRAQVGLGGHAVLEVGDLVGAVGQRLGERDQQVGRVAFAPAGHQHRQPVQHQAAKALVVARQVVDVGHVRDFRGAGAGCTAVEVAGAIDLEAECDLRERRVYAVGGRVRSGQCHQAQGVAREITGAVQLHLQGAAAGRHVQHARVAHALAAAHLDVGGRQWNGGRLGQVVHEVQHQARLAVHHLQVLDAVEPARRRFQRRGAQGGDAARVLAEVLLRGHGERLLVKLASPACCVSSTV